MLPDFNRLKVFYHIYNAQSMVDASKELHITQSAVSQHLKNLEKEVGHPLFTRLHKGILPTDAGDRLFEIVRPFIRELTTGLKNIEYSGKVPCGVLRVGAPREFGQRNLINMFADFQKEYPEVSFELTLEHPDKLLSMIRNNELDFALADIFAKKGDQAKEFTIFSIKKMTSENLILACSKNYYKASEGLDNFPGDLGSHKFIAYQKHYPAIRNWFLHHYKMSSVKLHISLTVESVRAVAAAIKQGMGLGLVPEHLIEGELRSGKLIQITTPKKDIANTISLVQLLDKTPTLAEKRFLEFLSKRVS